MADFGGDGMKSRAHAHGLPDEGANEYAGEDEGTAAVHGDAAFSTVI
jgi:hypothetical protein